MRSKYFAAEVIERRDLTDRIAEFCIASHDGTALPVGEAGSHIEVRFGPEEGRYLRHYSLVGSLTADRRDDPYWRIAVQREDRARGSAYIHMHFRKGTALSVSQPISAFRLGRDAPHTMLIAGGVGITAILPMMRSLVLRKRSFSMLYTGRSRDEMAFVDDAVRIGGAAVTIHESALHGKPDLRVLIALQPDATEVFVCGPSAMIETVCEATSAAGWAPSRVHFEVFNAAHRPDDLSMSVRLNDGRVVPVAAGTTILDALEIAGVETLSDCRRGECGLCVTGVVGTGADIDHRDTFLSRQEKVDSKQICICVSRCRTHGTIDLDIGDRSASA